MSNYWLIVERPENWEIDKNDNFIHFGLSERRKKLGNQVKMEDFLISYISGGISAFADIRRVIANGTHRLRGSSYDTGFPICLKTEPYLILPRNKWIPIKELLDKLSLLNEAKDWRQTVRGSIKKLSQSDSSIIINAMWKATENEQVNK